MSDTSDVQRDLVKTLYEQHWLHARHVEHERLLITNVYAILFAGSAAAYRTEFFSESAAPAHIFLMLMAIFCAAFSIKIDAIFKGHTEKASSLAENYGFPSPLENLVGPHWVHRWVRISRLFPYFFALCFSFLLGVLLSNLSWASQFYAYLIIPIAVFGALLRFFDQLTYDKEKRRYEKNSCPLAEDGDA